MPKYTVTQPNIRIKGKKVEVGEEIELSADRAKNLVNKISLVVPKKTAKKAAKKTAAKKDSSSENSEDSAK